MKASFLAGAPKHVDFLDWKHCLFKRMCLQHMVGVTDGFPVVGTSSLEHLIDVFALALSFCVCARVSCLFCLSFFRKTRSVLGESSITTTVPVRICSSSCCAMGCWYKTVREAMRMLNMGQVLSQKRFKSTGFLSRQEHLTRKTSCKQQARVSESRKNAWLRDPFWGAKAKSAVIAAACASGTPVQLSADASESLCLENYGETRWSLWLLWLLQQFWYKSSFGSPKSGMSCGMESALMITARHLRTEASASPTHLGLLNEKSTPPTLQFWLRRTFNFATSTVAKQQDWPVYLQCGSSRKEEPPVRQVRWVGKFIESIAIVHWTNLNLCTLNPYRSSVKEMVNCIYLHDTHWHTFSLGLVVWPDLGVQD